MELLLLNLEALVAIHGENPPSHHEVCLILFEESDHVLCWQVVLFELLDNNKNEQVKHHMTANKDDCEEVNVGMLLSAGLLRHTIWGNPAAVEHDLVPILTCCDREQQQERVEEVVEVLQIVDYVSLFHIAEHEHSKDGEHEEDEHEKHEYIDEHGNGEHDRLYNCLKSLRLARESQYPSYSQHSHYSCKLWTNFEQLDSLLV